MNLLRGLFICLWLAVSSTTEARFERLCFPVTDDESLDIENQKNMDVARRGWPSLGDVAFEACRLPEAPRASAIFGSTRPPKSGATIYFSDSDELTQRLLLEGHCVFFLTTEDPLEQNWFPAQRSESNCVTGLYRNTYSFAKVLDETKHLSPSVSSVVILHDVGSHPLIPRVSRYLDECEGHAQTCSAIEAKLFVTNDSRRAGVKANYAPKRTALFLDDSIKPLARRKELITWATQHGYLTIGPQFGDAFEGAALTVSGAFSPSLYARAAEMLVLARQGDPLWKIPLAKPRSVNTWANGKTLQALKIRPSRTYLRTVDAFREK